MLTRRKILAMAAPIAVACVTPLGHASTIGEHSHNLIALREVLQQNNTDVHVLSDSIGIPNDKRYATSIAWIIEGLTGELPTRVGSGAGDYSTRRRFGMGLRNLITPQMDRVEALQSDPYVTPDGRGPLSMGGQGSVLPYDGSRTFATSDSETGTIARIEANATESAGLTAGGALRNVIVPGQSNRVITDLFVQAGADGLPDRGIIIQDRDRNGPPIASFNPSTDLAGYRHLGEDPAIARGSAIQGMVGRVVPGFRVTGQTTGNETLRAVMSDAQRTAEQSNDPVDDGTNLTFVGMVMSRADAGWQWVGGTALFHHGGSSWDLDDWATSMPATQSEPKRFSDDQWLHAMDAWTYDVSRRSVYILCIASENNTTIEQVRDDTIALMDRLTVADAALGKPLPFFALVQWHRQGSLDEVIQRDWYEGYEQAAATRPNAASLDAVGLLDYTVFDGSPAAQQYLADRSMTSVTFGHVVDGDLTLANLVADGTHQTDDMSNAFFALTVARALRSVGCPGDCDGNGEIDFADLVSMLDRFGSDLSRCDADGSGVVDFGDLVSALAVFGPCF